jgi:hypothetical protein
VAAIAKRAGLGSVYPHMLSAFIMAAPDAGIPLRDVQIAARHADPRTTTIDDRRRENFDRHAAYVVVGYHDHARSNAGDWGQIEPVLATVVLGHLSVDRTGVTRA